MLRESLALPLQESNLSNCRALVDIDAPFRAEAEKHVEAKPGKYEFQGLQETNLVSLLKSCARQKDLCKGIRIHAEVLKQGILGKDTYVGNTLIHMYAKCGALTKAQEVFDKLSFRSVVSWNALIAGYTHNGCADEAFEWFEKMQDEGLSPTAVTFVCILKACAKQRALEKGEKIRLEVGRQGLLGKNVVIGTALVDMYAKCGALAKAQEVFDELPIRDVVTWSALIAGYAQHRHGDDALKWFERMQTAGILPNAATLVSVLQACGSTGSFKKGEWLHAEIAREGLLEKDLVLGNALLDMYAQCGMLIKAREVFNELPIRDVISWNALIAGYVQHGCAKEALNCFGHMQDECFFPNEATYVSILKACSSIGAYEKGEVIHAEINRQQLLKDNVLLGTALMDMYAKCGALSKAQELFDKLPTRDVVSWSALIAGYIDHGDTNKALNCFERMQDEGLSPNAITYVYILKVCSTLGATGNGEEIHAEISRKRLLEKNCILATALVDMYAKSGALNKAQEVFDELPVHDAVSWSALMVGYSQLGKVEIVFHLFRKIIKTGVKPDMVLFAVLLTSCSHSGLVEDGQMYYEMMRHLYCITPTLEHQTCMVDLYGRAGHFDKAINVVQEFPSSDCLPLWSTVLGCCRKWVNLELGRWSFERATELDENHTSAYICLRNIFIEADVQKEG